MSDDILLKQILGPFKEYRKVQPKEEETIDDGTGVIKVLFFPVDDISANEFGYEWKMKTVKDEFMEQRQKQGFCAVSRRKKSRHEKAFEYLTKMVVITLRQIFYRD